MARAAKKTPAMARKPRVRTVPTVPPEPPLTPPPFDWSRAIEVLRTRPGPRDRNPDSARPFVGLPLPPPGVRPRNDPVENTDRRVTQMAMDSGAITALPGTAEATSINVGLFNWASGGLWGEGLFFPGYPYLAELQQRPEYRHMVETLAEEMTRKWMKLVSRGDDDKTDAIKKLDSAIEKFNCRAVWRRAIELDGFMGMGFIYIDIANVWNDPEELRSPLIISRNKIAKDSLRGFVPIDPTWTSPVNYNATNPLQPDFYVPDTWYVMGRQVHASRLLIIRQREVPDILKPAYNFGGVSISQLAKPYVDNWLRTRQSVSDLLHSFTVFVLKTSMQTYLQDAQAFAARLTAFVLGRDNKGVFAVDKETEDFANVSAPLGGLDHLQSQAQEQMASVSKEPLVKLLGITPTGLNATSDGEIRVFYDHIHAEQERTPATTFTRALQIIQLSECGSIDDDIRFEWLPLWELDEAGKAAVQKTKADTDAVLTEGGIISTEEARNRLAADLESPYHGLEGPPPEPEDLAGMEQSETDDPTNRIDRGGAEGQETGANSGV